MIPATCQVEAEQLSSCRVGWATEGIQRQVGQANETLYQNIKKFKRVGDGHIFRVIYIYEVLGSVLEKQ